MSRLELPNAASPDLGRSDAAERVGRTKPKKRVRLAFQESQQTYLRFCWLFRMLLLTRTTPRMPRLRISRATRLRPSRSPTLAQLRVDPATRTCQRTTVDRLDPRSQFGVPTRATRRSPPQPRVVLAGGDPSTRHIVATPRSARFALTNSNTFPVSSPSPAPTTPRPCQNVPLFAQTPVLALHAPQTRKIGG